MQLSDSRSTVMQVCDLQLINEPPLDCWLLAEDPHQHLWHLIAYKVKLKIATFLS